MNKYSNARLAVLFFLLIIYFILNYLSAGYFTKKDELKQTISNLIIYDLGASTLHNDPFVTDAVRSGMIGGVAIPNTKQYANSTNRKPNSDTILKSIQALSKRSTHHLVFVINQLENFDSILSSSEFKQDTVAKIPVKGIQLLPATSNLKQQDRGRSYFSLSSFGKIPSGGLAMVFKNSDDMKLMVLYKPNDVEKAITEAVKDKFDLLYVKQRSEGRTYRIFQLVNFINDTIEQDRVARSTIIKAYQKVVLLRDKLIDPN